MKRIILAMAIIASLSFRASAQQTPKSAPQFKGTTQISGGLEVAFPAGDFGNAYKTGFGINAKALYGITGDGQITGTTGYQSFTQKGSSKNYKVKINVIPVLAGYRHNFKSVGIYAEPQLGVGIYGAKVKSGDQKDTDSDVHFTWALGGGYVYGNYDFSLRYQSGEATGRSIGIFALKIAYNFTLPKK